MGDPPAYPPPPPGPPGEAPPPPTYPTAHDYDGPYVYSPPTAQYLVSRNLTAVIAAAVAVAVLLLGVIGYGVAGYAVASIRLSGATNAVNAASAHRGYVNTTFDLLDQQITSLQNMSDGKQAKSTSGQMVTESQNLSTTVGGDDQALAAARSRLKEQQWLTVISSSSLAAEARRIDHTRKAIADVRSAAGDYVLFGEFLQTYFQTAIDWAALLAAANNSDFIADASALTMFQSDIDKALQQSSAPGLPHEYHDYLLALQAYAADSAKELNAIAVGDRIALAAAEKLVQADLANMQAVTFTGTTAQIRSHYERYRTDFNAEMDRATA